MGIQHDGLDAGEDLAFADAPGAQELPLHGAVREVEHRQDVGVGEGASDEIQRIDVIGDMRLPAGLDVVVEAFRDDDEGGQAARLHVAARAVEIVVVDDLAQLRGVELLAEGPGGGAAVAVHDPDRQVVRQPVLHEGHVEDRVEDHHPHRRQDVDRALAEDADLAADDFPDLSHFCRYIRMALMPGRSPSTSWSGRARTSKVRVSNSPVSRVAFQVA